MNMQINPSSEERNIQTKIKSLSLKVRSSAFERIIGDINIDYNPVTFDIEKFVHKFSKYRSGIDLSDLYKTKDYSEEKFTKYLQQTLNSPDKLKEFMLVFAERVFLSEKIKLKGIHEDTAALLE